MRKTSVGAALTAGLMACSLSLLATPASHVLWYEQPATNWQTEALPIGNGKLGAMIFGNVECERIMFNEDSLWIGDESDTGAYQAFGDVYVRLHPESFSLSYSSPSHGQGEGEGVGQALMPTPKANGVWSTTTKRWWLR